VRQRAARQRPRFSAHGAFTSLLAAILMSTFAAGPRAAQAESQDTERFGMRIEEALRVLAGEPSLAQMAAPQRREFLEFVVGNILFVAAHELGHGVLAELNLPNLGREEDAADAFAILTALELRTQFSDRILLEGARGFYLAEMRRRRVGRPNAYYGRHGLNLQRAYQIVCFMVGSDPVRFGELAAMAKMPEHRQKSCGHDFALAAWSWETLLEPHGRTPAQPKQHVDVIYGDGEGGLGVLERVFREVRFLETLAEYATDRFAWPRPFTMEMQTCGQVGASWRARRLKICYEMVHWFAELYHGYAHYSSFSRRR
jgi:Putative metallopeptidase